MIETSCITSEHQFLSLAAAWEDLRSDAPGSSIFVAHDWMLAWLRSYGSDQRPYVLVAQDQGSIVGALPLCMARTRSARRALHFVGHGYADYSDALVREAVPDAIDSLIACLLGHHEQWDYLDLRYLSLASSLLVALQPDRYPEWLVRARLRMRSPYVRVAGDWSVHVSSRFRQQLRRKRRKLEKCYGSVSMAIATDPAEVEASLRVFYELHRLRWESMKGAISSFTIRADRVRHARMFSNTAETRRTIVFTLRAGGLPAAVAVCLLDGATLYYCQPTFHPDFAAYSPSHLLIAEIVDFCWENDLATLDFLRGDEPYKYLWTDQARTLAEVWLSTPNLYCRAAALWHLDVRGQLRAAPMVGAGLVKGRWLVRRLAERRVAGSE